MQRKRWGKDGDINVKRGLKDLSLHSHLGRRWTNVEMRSKLFRVSFAVNITHCCSGITNLPSKVR